MNTRILISFAAMGAMLLAPVAHAQYEIKSGVRNLLDSRQAGASATVSAEGVVTAINIGTGSGGAGYTSPPIVTIGPGATTATGTAVLTGGVVTSVTITRGGSGYDPGAPPTVSIAELDAVLAKYSAEQADRWDREWTDLDQEDFLAYYVPPRYSLLVETAHREVSLPL
jgi:hypothetical protein